MGVQIRDMKLVIITKPKKFPFDLLKDIGKNWMHETDSITKHNEFLGEHVIKRRD